MALKLDEDYNGTTLLSAWWQKVKNNFAAIKTFVDALEADKVSTADVEAAVADKADKAELHEHSNMSILDTITQDTVNSWQEVADAVDDLNKEMSGKYESGLGDKIVELQTTTEALDKRIDELEADGAVTESRIADGAVSASKLMDISVVTSKIADRAVTEDKLSADLQEKINGTTIISDSATTSVTIVPKNNYEYRYGTLTSLSISMEAPDEDYAAWIVFTSGAEVAEVSHINNIYWSGNDVLNNVFMPMANKRYNIGLWYDGVCMNAVVRGVSL